MNETFAAALGALILASAAFFFLGRRIGTAAEVKRLAATKGTAEETGKRIVTEAEREAENLRKSAVVPARRSSSSSAKSSSRKCAATRGGRARRAPHHRARDRPRSKVRCSRAARSRPREAGERIRPAGKNSRAARGGVDYPDQRGAAAPRADGTRRNCNQ